MKPMVYCGFSSSVLTPYLYNSVFRLLFRAAAACVPLRCDITLHGWFDSDVPFGFYCFTIIIEKRTV